MISTDTTLQKKRNRQKAFDYCMYMMLTSYFKQSVCKSRYIEKQLFLYYQEEKSYNQIAMEEQCVKLIEEEILPKIPHKYQNARVDTHLQQCKDAVHTRLLVHTGNYILCIYTAYDKQKPQVIMSQWVKKSSDVA